MTGLSLCAIALNEEQFLDGMLASVHGVVDEVVLGIDSRTTDATETIARAHGARTFRFDWHDSFAEACNLAIERARCEWILRLDADERLLPEGRVRISELLALGVPLDVDGFLMLLLETDLDGRALGPPQRSAARLFRNVPDLRYMGRIHE
ncbi:MAG TPA: glycosyltransferase, partial [Chloroflexota bacterium]|nr:glycosyltransferase [Chloroflexota bacterium]